jgi:hypothetical protein
MFPFDRLVVLIEEYTPNVTHQEDEDQENEQGAYDLE